MFHWPSIPRRTHRIEAAVATFATGAHPAGFAPLQRAATLLIALVVLLWLPQAALALSEPSLKVGLNRLTLTGVTYSHDTGTEIVTEDSALVGNELFLEWLPADRLGLEFGTTLTPLSRTYKLKGASTISDTVTESLANVALGLNLYFSRARRRGFTFLLGLGVGSGTVTHAFEGGTLGTKSSANKLTTNTVKLGMDWVTDLAGLRLEYLYVTGQTRSTTALPSASLQEIKVAGSVIGLGIYAFF